MLNVDSVLRSLFLYVIDQHTKKIKRVGVPSDFQIGTSKIPAMLDMYGGFALNTSNHVASSHNSGIIKIDQHDTIVNINVSDEQPSAIFAVLPTQPREGQVHIIKDIAGVASGSAFTITTDDNSTIDGSETTTIATNYGSNIIYWANGEWHVLSSGGGSTGASGAPINASYVTVSSESGLSNERILTAGANVSIVDNGPGSTIVISSTTGSAGVVVPAPTQNFQMLVSTGSNWILVPPPASTLTDTLMYTGTSVEWVGRTYESQQVSANTVALWRLNTAVSGLLDLGPNGLDLAVFAGTARGASAWPTMGGVYFDGTVGLRAPASALLQLTGDMTIAFVTTGFRDGTLNSSQFFACSAFGETEATNYLYSLGYGTFPALTYLHEHGAGVNATHNWGTSSGQHVFASWNIPVMVHVVRASNVINLYMQGILITPSSSALTAPTGGTDSRLTIGCSVLGAAGTFANGYNGVITDFLVENRAWTDDDVKFNFNRCLGPVMGRRP